MTRTRLICAALATSLLLAGCAAQPTTPPAETVCTARAQLEKGGDVEVPQFLRRPELIERFRDLAGETGATGTPTCMAPSIARTGRKSWTGSSR